MTDSAVKIAVLEQKFEDFRLVVSKIDDAIEKLSQVSTTVGKMLAVHDEKILNQSQVDKILFEKIDNLSEKNNKDHEKVMLRIQSMERKIWLGMGILAAFCFILSYPSTFGKLLTIPTPDAKINSQMLKK